MSLAALVLSLAAPAAAATNEVSFEVGWIGAWDPAFDFFYDGNTLPSVGLRVGYAVHPNVAIIAGWQHMAVGSDVDVPSVGSAGTDEDYYDYGGFTAALYTDQVSVGAKADVRLWKWLHPYVAAQVVGMRGLARLDDDAGDDENLTQVQVAGLTGGFNGAAGLDFLIKVRGDVYIAPYVELGYGWMAPLQLGELGSVQFGGFAGRTGLGVRF